MSSGGPPIQGRHKLPFWLAYTPQSLNIISKHQPASLPPPVPAPQPARPTLPSRQNIETNMDKPLIPYQHDSEESDDERLLIDEMSYRRTSAKKGVRRSNHEGEIDRRFNALMEAEERRTKVSELKTYWQWCNLCQQPFDHKEVMAACVDSSL